MATSTPMLCLRSLWRSPMVHEHIGVQHLLALADEVPQPCTPPAPAKSSSLPLRFRRSGGMRAALFASSARAAALDKNLVVEVVVLEDVSVGQKCTSVPRFSVSPVTFMGDTSIAGSPAPPGGFCTKPRANPGKFAVGALCTVRRSHLTHAFTQLNPHAADRPRLCSCSC